MAQTAKWGFDDAFSHYKAGNYQKCTEVCSRLLLGQSNNTDILQLLGSSQFLLKDYDGALKTYETLLGFLPNNKEILNTYGCILRDLGRFGEAISILQKALQIDNSYVNAAVNLAYCYHRSGEFENAIIFYKQLTTLYPEKVEYLQNYADALFQNNDFSNALQIYQTLNKLNPNSEQTIARTAWCLFQLEKKQEAIILLTDNSLIKTSSFLRLELGRLYYKCEMPDEANSSLYELTETTDTETLVLIGGAFYDHNQYEKAIEVFQKVLEYDPSNFDALNNLGVSYDQIDDEENALFYFNKLLELNPNSARILSSIGAVYQKLDDLKTCISYYDKALAVDPEFVSAIYNKGVALHESGYYEESTHYFTKTLAHQPDHEDASYNLGINFLISGNYKQGFRHYFKRPRFPLETDKLTPITPGMDLNNKKILFTRSQGIGDELFFLRFSHLAKKETNTIYYRADPKIASICERIPFIDEVVAKYPDEEYDYCFEIDDLPLLLDIQQESQLPPPLPLEPLSSSIECVKKLLGSNVDLPLMGITWRAGSKEKCPNRELNYQVLKKEIPLETLSDAIETYEGKFVILQRNPLDTELEYLKSRFGDRIIDLSDLNEKLEDMLALLSLLDKHVGVSNTNVHLRAGLHLTADILVPFPPDWRWLTSGDTSPWFPRFKVFRQCADGQWNIANQLIS